MGISLRRTRFIFGGAFEGRLGEQFNVTLTEEVSTELLKSAHFLLCLHKPSIQLSGLPFCDKTQIQFSADTKL